MVNNVVNADTVGVGYVCARSFLYGAHIFLEVFYISKKSLINEQIRAKEVRVISEEGKQLGVVPIATALNLANEAGLDLVEIAPEAEPPVCKIMDFGKYRFEKEKREKEIRKKKQVVDLKEIQLKCRIDVHDFQTKLNHAMRFLAGGDKVKVMLKFMGREITHPERGEEVLARFLEGCNDMCAVEKPAALDGRNMIMILAPKKQSATQKGKEKNGED